MGKQKKGLEFDTLAFSPQSGSPPETKLVTAEIKDFKGNVIFRQEDVEIPTTWDQQAANVVASKYFYGPENAPRDLQVSAGGRERSVIQLVRRVAGAIANKGVGLGYFASPDDHKRFLSDLQHICWGQYASFNSPVWFNVGLWDSYGIKGGSEGFGWRWDQRKAATTPLKPGELYVYPQASACFIISVDDNLKSIFERSVTEGMLFKYGSGVGADNSTIRSRHEVINGGGRPSGPLSFMGIYDAVAKVTHSGGRVRRAAKHEILHIHHPDIEEFIDAKWLEEQKAKALIRQGYPADFNGEAYRTVNFQNSNFSVRATDAFMRKVTGEDPDPLWQTTAVTTGSPVCDGRRMPSFDAKALLRRMAERNWACGDPGIQFDDTIQHWHTTPNAGRIHASNPCAEFIHVDNTACNLASLNLLRFLKADGSFDYFRFGHAVEVLVTAQDILIDSSSYPTEAIARNSHDLRPIGLGYTNVGALLMAKGLPYDSDEGRTLIATITSYMTMTAYQQSAVMAGELGAYAGFKADREGHLKVLRMHRDAAAQLPAAALASCPGNLLKEWERVIELAEQYGLRNSQVTSIAPAGTISFMMGAQTTGIEPELALVKYKKLAGGGSMTLVNDTVKTALLRLGYDDKLRVEIAGEQVANVLPSPVARIGTYINQHGTIEGCPALKPEHLPVFDCSFPPLGGAQTLSDGTPIEGRSLHYSAHIKMLAAVQPHISTAVSKTINMSRSATVENFFNTYIEAWKLGLKAVALYRDGCKDSQPLSTCKEDKDATRSGSDDDAARGGVGGGVPAERDLPDLLAKATAASQMLLTALDPKLGTAGCEDGSDFTVEIKVSSPATGLTTNGGTTTDGAGESDRDADARDAVRPPVSLLPAAEHPVVGGSAGAAAKAGGSRAHAAAGEPAAAVAADAARGDRHGGTEDQQADVQHHLDPVRSWSRTVTGAGGAGQPTRHKLPLTRMSLTHKFDVGAHGGYLNVGLYDDGKVGELFITMDKEGSIVAGLMDALATTCSIGLQYGVPLEAFVRKLAFTAYEPNGMTNDKDVPFAKSLVDYIFRKLGILYVPGYREEVQGPSSPDKPVDERAAQMVDLARRSLTTRQLEASAGHRDDPCYVREVARLIKEAEVRGTAVSAIDLLAAKSLCGAKQVEDSRIVQVQHRQRDTAKRATSLLDEEDAKFIANLHVVMNEPAARPAVPAEHGPPCDQCGHLMVRAGACYRCLNCGSQGGCG